MLLSSYDIESKSILKFQSFLTGLEYMAIAFNHGIVCSFNIVIGIISIVSIMGTISITVLSVLLELLKSSVLSIRSLLSGLSVLLIFVVELAKIVDNQNP